VIEFLIIILSSHFVSYLMHKNLMWIHPGTCFDCISYNILSKTLQYVSYESLYSMRLTSILDMNKQALEQL